MTAYLRLLDLLARDIEPWRFLSDVCLHRGLADLHGYPLVADATDLRALFHGALQRARQAGVLEGLFSVLAHQRPALAAELAELRREVWERPSLPPGASSGPSLVRSPDVCGTFDLVVDSSGGALQVAALDRWLAGLVGEGRVGAVHLETARSLWSEGEVAGGRTLLQLGCTAADFIHLWHRVQSGDMARLGRHWVCGMGRFRPLSTDGLDEPSELVELVISDLDADIAARAGGALGARYSG